MIQVELNGILTEVSKHQLFALAKRGEIGPNTRIIFSGKESTAGKIKGIEFGKPEVRFDFAEQEFMGVADGLEIEPPEYEPAPSPRFTSTNVPMESVFPHLAAVGRMLMMYNFIFFLLTAIGVCGVFWEFAGGMENPYGVWPLVGSLLLLFCVFLFWHTIYGSISDFTKLAFSLHQNSKKQTELLEKILESTPQK